MKNLVLVIIAVTAVYALWDMNRAARISGIDTPAGQYVFVYGRDGCGYTRRMRSQLDSAGIRYSYKTIDDRSVADSLHKRMRSAGVSTRRYNLPVVEVNAYIFGSTGYW